MANNTSGNVGAPPLRSAARGHCVLGIAHLLALGFVASPIVASAQRTGAPAVRVLADVPYKSDATTDYERERCKLDLYLPQDEQGFATIVWFHGGGLQNGDKRDAIAAGMAQRFSSEGFAVASVNYRLSPRVSFPAYVEDAAAAVAFVCREIAGHGGAAERVFVSGHSAGGYLTSMVGTDARYLGRHQLGLDAIAGCLPVSGQMVTHSTVRGERGIERTQPTIDDAAPAFYVGPKTPPFLCIVGGDDLPARAEENRYFVAAMRAAGHTSVVYLEVAGRDHGSIASRMDEPNDAVAAAMHRFVQGVH